MSETLILHEYAASGNCYKVRLTAALLGLPLERREYDIMAGETRSADFLAADIALYAYTHVAEGGGFRLADYPALQAWVRRVEGVPDYVAMTA